ncbi:porin [Stenotrophomonas pictorum JCM 9942]|uniref:Porin n=1 Tax=Stenotrophomonas pictorum JCM 9942 TaxID=1236960 RepID=A0A0R0A2S5_9GAMM|nr:porin [Stenotrophomonas pictorum]KRG39429.1 porin [Stenotrophomonas pictorum JCM 9942]
MKRIALPCLLLCVTLPAAAQTQTWPPRLKTASGDELTLTGNVAYDAADFSGSGHAGAVLHDDTGWRRKEFGIGYKRAGRYDVTVGYDFQSKTWLDVALRLETKALFGRDLGKLRLGQSKMAVGFEGATASRAGSYIEASLPTQAFYESRRTGVDWAYEQPLYILNAGYYFGSDLQGNNRGDTAAARLAWTPWKASGNVLHLGVSASKESPEGEVDGRDQYRAPTARWRARAGSALTTDRLVDSGTLRDIQQLQRRGIEALWINGPWSLQGEYQQQTARRGSGLPDYRGYGGYASASWLVTGESRPYSAGNVGNPKPGHRHGAVELLLRRDHLDLDDAGIAGGRARSWTLGANWYLGPNLKFQGNYVRADARRAGSHVDPHLLSLRAQLHF